MTTFARNQLLWALNEASRVGLATANYFPHDPPLIARASFANAVLADTDNSIPVPLSVHQRGGTYFCGATTTKRALLRRIDRALTPSDGSGTLKTDQLIAQSSRRHCRTYGR